MISALSGAMSVLSGQTALTTASVSIEIRDLWTDSAVRDVAVVLPDVGVAGLTDIDGFLHFERVPGGTWDLNATAWGYADLHSSLEVGTADTVRLYIEPDVIALEGFEVIRERRTYVKELRKHRNARRPMSPVVPRRVLRAAPHSKALGFIEGRFGALTLDMHSRCPMIMGGGELKMLLFFMDEVLVTPAEFEALGPSDLDYVEYYPGAWIRAFTPGYLSLMDARGVLPSPAPDDRGVCDTHTAPQHHDDYMWKKEVPPTDTLTAPALGAAGIH